MPIYEVKCSNCNHIGEVLVSSSSASVSCPSCGSDHTARLMSATSSLTGRNGQVMPGPYDTACCGSTPGASAGCEGPGSCCGKR